MLAPEDLSGVYGDDEMNQAEIETEKEVKQLPETKTVKGAKLKTFDPTKERIEQGKYDGSLWAELPVDYLTWMSKDGTDKAKAVATLAYLDANNKQVKEKDAFDGVFDAEISQEDKDKYEVLKQAIDTLDTKVKLLKWGEEHAEEIKKLPPALLTKLKKYYKSKLGKNGAKK
jgi:DNA repair protein RadC